MDSEAYRLLKAALACIRAGEWQEGLPRLQAALEAARNEGPQVLATVARSAGLAYERCGRLAEAEQALETAATSDPLDGRTALVLAGLKHQLGHSGAAVAQLDRARKIAEDTDDEELRVMVERSGLGQGRNE